MKIILENNSSAPKLASNFLQQKKIISFATDTVYGIAADACDQESINKIYEIKKRETQKPIAIFLPNLKIAREIFIFDEIAEKIAAKISQDSLTLILKKRSKCAFRLALNLNKNDDFLGFRIVKNNFITKLFTEFNGILAVTSANISGKNPAINASQILQDKDLQTIDLLVDGGVCSKKIPSTVIKINDGKIEILRGNKNYIP